MTGHPLDSVKLDLAIIGVVGVLLLLISGRFPSALLQLAALLGYGLFGMLWVVVRTRSVLSRLRKSENTDLNGSP